MAYCERDHPAHARVSGEARASDATGRESGSGTLDQMISSRMPFSYKLAFCQESSSALSAEQQQYFADQLEQPPAYLQNKRYVLLNRS